MFTLVLFLNLATAFFLAFFLARLIVLNVAHDPDATDYVFMGFVTVLFTILFSFIGLLLAAAWIPSLLVAAAIIVMIKYMKKLGPTVDILTDKLADWIEK